MKKRYVVTLALIVYIILKLFVTQTESKVDDTIPDKAIDLFIRLASFDSNRD